MRSVTQAIACAGLILAASPALSETINLNPPNNGTLGNVYSQSGYTFTNSVQSSDAYINWVAYGRPDFNADPTGPDLLANFYGSTNTLTKSGGGAFDFYGISLANEYNVALGGDVRFTFNYANGTSGTSTVTLANMSGLQAFAFNQKGVTSVVFTTSDATAGTLPEIQFDYAVVGSVSTVPLPASLPMFGGAVIALGGLGFSRRRRTGRDSAATA